MECQIYYRIKKSQNLFKAIHKSTKDYLKYSSHNVQPVHMFFSSNSAGTSKFHLVKVIYNAISKTLLYYCKDPEKPRVLSLGPKGI